MVGAGTAGCTLAARLTENPSVQVLLIEAGPPGPGHEISTPSAYPKLLESNLNWGDATEPQENLNGRRLAWPRGEVLGGSGALSASIHVRGCRADYDAWRDLGNPGWGFEDLAPLWTDPPAGGDAPAVNQLTEVFLRACGECGIRRYDQFDGPAEEGAGFYPVARVRGERWDATSAFLRPALKRGNLTVWTGVHACRILFETARATGVEYLLRGRRQQVSAEREVILCAGTVGSAQLLLLSGLGPPEQLEPLSIPIVAALAGVGSNLQDHIAAGMRWKCSQPVSLDGTCTFRNAWRYRIRREGPLASNLIEAGAYLRSRKDAAACDLEILFAPLYSLERGVRSRGAQHGFTLLAALLTPVSRGTLRLASADPLARPFIDPSYLAAAEDRDRLKQAAERARKIAESEAIKPFRDSIVQDEIEELAVSLHHGVGTCRMGNDDGSVVDAELRVRGVTGLRVADASVMPTIPRSHPNATVMVIAEQAARLIQSA